MSRNLALFDFDGTLTTKDSLSEFIKFVVGDIEYYIGLFKFLPIFLRWKLGLIKNYEAKERLLCLYFCGKKQTFIQFKAKEYSQIMIDKILRDTTYKLFLKHIENDDRVVVVSASMRCWIEPWCTKHNVELLSTELAFEDGVFRGRFATKNCHANEKVNRIKKLLNIDDYEHIYAYGDSSGDKEMLALADESFYKLK